MENTEKYQERLETATSDLQKLTQMKEIYESTSDNLCGTFYNEINVVLNEQIEYIEQLVEIYKSKL